MQVLVMLNGKKAGAPEIRESIGELRNAGHEVHVRTTWEHGDLARFIDEARVLGIRRLVVGGGDGSINEAVNGLMQIPLDQRPELAILPLGTANDFARGCGVPPEIPAAMKLAIGGNASSIDVIRANENFFLNAASAGYGAAITAETQPQLKNFLGGLAYTLTGVLKALNFKPYPTFVRFPDEDVRGDFIFGVVCNGRQTGGGHVLAPEAMLDDGLLDILVVRHFPVSATDQVFREFRNPSPDNQYVLRKTTTSFESESENPIPMNLDGEPQRVQRVSMAIQPQQLNVVLPAVCPCTINKPPGKTDL